MEKVAQAASKATFKNLRHAGFSVSKKAKSSIVKGDEPSAPGSPPTTRGQGGKNLRGAIYVDAEPESVVIGPRESWVGDVGEVLEFGGTRGEEAIEERPFMQPALLASLDRFADTWEGSIGE